MKRLLTLLLLLAPSVLAQNPVSGGPIPQSTYQTPSMIGGGGGGISYGLGSGTAQAQIIASPSPTIGALTNGVQVCWLPVAANSGAAPTLQVGTLTAKPITKYGTIALIANDIVTSTVACAVYDGTEFQLQMPKAGSIQTTSYQAVGASAQAMNLYVSGGCDGISACTGFSWGFIAPASLAASLQYTGNLTDGSGNSAFVTDGAQHLSTVQLPQYIAGAGAADVMTATYVPAFSAYAAGEEFDVLPNLANTLTNPTFNVNGLGAKTVTKCGTAVLAAGDLSTTAVAKFIYDGTRMQLQNPQVGGCGSSFPLLAPNGTVGAPSYSFSAHPTYGYYFDANGGFQAFSVNSTEVLGLLGTGLFMPSGSGVTWGSTLGAAQDAGMFRDGAGVVDVGNGTPQDVTGTIRPGKYSSGTNCSSSASPAVCGSAAAGSVAVPTGVTPTLVVNTTAVTANSQILFTPDESLGTKLGVTCNSTIAQVAIEPIVTARTAATSFTIQYNTTITVNPICLSYFIMN